jgi:general stress protein 26
MATSKDITARLAGILEEIDVAMLTTVGPGGYLVSRPVSTRATEFDGRRLWFFTEADSPKADEIARNGKVNLAYASKDRNTYVSLAGDARISHDQRRISRYWNDALKVFFPQGRNDPNLALIEVNVRTAEYWDGPGSLFGKAITFLVARVTGSEDVLAENQVVDMATGRSRPPPSRKTGKQPTRAAVRKVSQPLTRGGAGSGSAATTPARAKAGTGRPAAKRASTKKAATRAPAPSKAVAKPASATKAAAKKRGAGPAKGSRR